MALDAINGFVGKTAIHPSQLPVIHDALMVTREDFEDAKAVIHWDNGNNAVSGGCRQDRMNELKCHSKWARKILCLANVYGVKDG
jgi:citrate lyase beta subunit